MDEIVGISGSALLETLFKKAEGGKLKIQPGKVINPILTLATPDFSQNENILYGITGEMAGGMKGVHFEGGLLKSPLRIVFSIHGELSEGKLTVNLGFDLTRWENQPILQLAFFEKLKTFFDFLEKSHSFEMNCEMDGNILFSAKAQLPDLMEFFQQILEYLEILDNLRFIAKAVGINPKYPINGKFSKQEINDIFLLYPLIQGQEFKQKVIGQKGEFTLEGDAQDYNNSDQKIKENGFGELAWEVAGQEFNLLGETFEFNSLRYTLIKVRIASKNWSQLDDRNDSCQNHFVIEWESGPDTELIIAKV